MKSILSVFMVGLMGQAFVPHVSAAAPYQSKICPVIFPRFAGH